MKCIQRMCVEVSEGIVHGEHLPTIHTESRLFLRRVGRDNIEYMFFYYFVI